MSGSNASSGKRIGGAKLGVFANSKPYLYTFDSEESLYTFDSEESRCSKPVRGLATAFDPVAGPAHSSRRRRKLVWA